MKIALINLIKGEYLDRIKALMILINKKLVLTRMQMIEYISYSLNLFVKSDFLKLDDNYNKNQTHNVKNFENFIIAEYLVEDIFQKQNLNKKQFLTISNIHDYFISNDFPIQSYFTFLIKNFKIFTL